METLKIYEEAYRQGYADAIKRIQDFCSSKDMKRAIENMHLCNMCKKRSICKGRNGVSIVCCRSWVEDITDEGK